MVGPVGQGEIVIFGGQNFKKLEQGTELKQCETNAISVKGKFKQAGFKFSCLDD